MIFLNIMLLWLAYTLQAPLPIKVIGYVSTFCYMLDALIKFGIGFSNHEHIDKS